YNKYIFKMQYNVKNYNIAFEFAFAFISSDNAAKNSSFDLVCLNFLINFSAKSGESDIALRSFHRISSWPFGTSNSSFLVPERRISIAGKILLSDSARSK